MLGLDRIARHGVRKMLTEALEAEVQAYVEAARSETLCGAEAVEVKAPRVNERRVDEVSATGRDSRA